MMLAAVAICGALSAQAEAPATAVFSLTAETGTSESTAKLVTDAVTQALRSSGVFSRVISASEIEALLNFERQRQTVNCDSVSCAEEVASALGVQFILVGNIGRLGNSFLLNIKLLDVKNARVASSSSERATGSSEEVLLDRIPGALTALLVTAGFSPAAISPTPTVPAL